GHQSRLLKQRRFAPFFWTQFLGAMNDNVFKIAFTSLVTYHASLFQNVDGKTAAFLISAIFIAPFLLFSATSGQIADKWDKARLIRFVKSLEIAIMALGAAGFLWASAPLLFVCTFLMGLHSTLFGPVKYAYLPQHLATRELVGGNGLVEMGTFVAILIGAIVGGELAGAGAGSLPWIGGVCLGLALLGRLVSTWVPQTPAAQPDLRINWNPLTETWRNLCIARTDRAVFQSLLGISWLWFLGATFLASFFNFAHDVLGAGPEHPVASAARRWLHARPGGVLSAPTWGKFWLALLGLYGRDGLRPLVPELALLPRAVPVHPVRFYCHTRYVYLAMSVLQGGHAKFDLGALG
ncbi:MAG: MFS transporter, partial [Pandoraea sp.]|nr:MFS transporter [Pandoraea sp.]